VWGRLVRSTEDRERWILRCGRSRRSFEELADRTRFQLASLDRKGSCALAQPGCRREVDDGGWSDLRQGPVGLVELIERSHWVLLLRGWRSQRGEDVRDRHGRHYVRSREVANNLDFAAGRDLSRPRSEQLESKRRSWNLSIRRRHSDHPTLSRPTPRCSCCGGVGARRPGHGTGCEPALSVSHHPYNAALIVISCSKKGVAIATGSSTAPEGRDIAHGTDPWSTSPSPFRMDRCAWLLGPAPKFRIRVCLRSTCLCPT